MTAPSLHIYPGVAGRYSARAWELAQNMTDGQITDDLLCSAEDLASRPRDLQADIEFCREALAHDERTLAWARERGEGWRIEQAERQVETSRALLARYEAETAR